jgi:hypothetical protein
MLDYIKENCQLPALEKPLYDADSDTWDLYFEEKECDWFPYPDAQLICIPFEDKTEADIVWIGANELIANESSLNTKG